jgi:site-specific DNA-methyltransferase (adenine-specific)
MAARVSRVICGNCLEVLPTLRSRSVNLVLCDLPYGTTANAWDRRQPLDDLWREFWRLLRPGGAVLMMGQQPFTAMVGASQIQHLRYEWIWEKGNATGFLNARRFPLKAHENVLVFTRELHKYRPQMEEGKPYASRSGGFSTNYGKFSMMPNVKHGTRFPRTVLRFGHERGLHPTQKPVGLFEYLIRTYTDRGDVVLDPCAGSGTAAVAAIRGGRGFVIIERERGYRAIARRRVIEARKETRKT